MFVLWSQLSVRCCFQSACLWFVFLCLCLCFVVIEVVCVCGVFSLSVYDVCLLRVWRWLVFLLRCARFVVFLCWRVFVQFLCKFLPICFVDLVGVCY